MSGISTHVLDTSKGKPVANIRVRLFEADIEIASQVTNKDGRCPVLLPHTKALIPGLYRIVFEIGSYFPAAFYPEVSIVFRIEDSSSHYHIPLLVSPFGYTTYRGS
jgi:5-hydroxyisourate hydrolase